MSTTKILRRGERGVPANTFKLRRFGVELRAASDGPEGVLEGYATVYDVGYGIGWGITEQIAPGCFDRSIADQNGIIPIFYQHDWDNPIGHATVTSDAKGVKVVATLYIDVNERAVSVWRAAAARALREWSIGFYPQTIELSYGDDGNDTETITEGDLAEASIVVRGANPETEMIDVRSKRDDQEDAPICAQVAALRAKIARTRDSDADEDPGAVAQAIDALVDLMFDENDEEGIDPESLSALLTALDVLVDRLLDLLGVNDPGEPADPPAPAPSPYALELDDETHDLLAEHVGRAWCRDELRSIQKTV